MLLLPPQIALTCTLIPQGLQMPWPSAPVTFYSHESLTDLNHYLTLGAGVGLYHVAPRNGSQEEGIDTGIQKSSTFASSESTVIQVMPQTPS